MVGYGENHILLTNGDYRSRFLSQNTKSINGKIIKIDTRAQNKYEIFSIGHRNPQGLYFDQDNNFVLSTEHGPMGGDEINLIDVKNIDQKLNFGWPISSAGKHYCSERAKTEKELESCSELYKKYPLHDSHTDFGFIEPLKSFVPSIGISEITKIDNETYVVSSLNGYSLYFFNLENNKVKNMKRIMVGERIRDIFFKNGDLYMFLEKTPMIAKISISTL